jgi:serine/threonine protein kinase
MGTFRARHKDHRHVVHLIIREVYDEDAALFLKDREREANLVLSLAHPNLVRVLEINVENAYIYVVEEWIDAEWLTDICRPRQPLPPQRVGKILGQLANALDYLHQRGAAHSGLKTNEIFLDSEDHVYSSVSPLVDSLILSFPFPWLDPVASKDSLFGSPSYMAPERLLGQTQPTVRSDIYELGTVVYEMLTGDVPYHGATPFDVIQHKDREDPPPFSSDITMNKMQYGIENEGKKGIAGALLALVRKPPKADPTPQPELSEDIKRIVARAIARSPEQRFSSAGEFATAFNAALIS